MKRLSSKRLTVISVLLLLFILTMTSCQSNTVTTENQTSKENQTTEFDLSVYDKAEDYFITPQDLKAGLDNGTVLLYDCNNPEVFDKTHIPGAVGIGFHAFTDTSGKPGDPLWGTLVDRVQLEKNLQKIGYDPNKTVVFYSDVFKGPGADGRTVWQLTLAGLTNAKILLGGSTYWEELGYEMTKEPSNPYPEYAGKIDIKDYDNSMFTTKEELYANLGNEPVLDVRTEKEFNGSQNAGEPRGGHITGSENMLWQDLLEKNGVLKSPEEIEKIMASYNVSKDQDATVYWTMGIRSGYTAMILKAVGFDKIKNYEASIYEWGKDETMPMEK